MIWLEKELWGGQLKKISWIRQLTFIKSWIRGSLFIVRQRTVKIAFLLQTTNNLSKEILTFNNDFNKQICLIHPNFFPYVQVAILVQILPLDTPLRIYWRFHVFYVKEIKMIKHISNMRNYVITLKFIHWAKLKKKNLNP